MRRILSGVRATGHLTIGNYLGALRNWVKLQHEGDEVLYFIADLHSLTEQPDPTELREAVRETAAAFIASGVDIERSALFAQSAVVGHTDLAWIFSSITPLGWLNRMTQFKDKAGKNRDNALHALYAYPVLMAADILLYKATDVPVGEDQKQHVELARDIAGAFNRQYGTEYFPLPEPLMVGEAARVMSLRDGTKKMSKTDESDYSRINLTDDADTIALKIRKAKTDLEPLPSEVAGLEGRPEAANLVMIYAALAKIPREEVLRQHGGSNFSAFKGALTELTVAEIGPISAKMREALADRGELDRVLAAGAARAGNIAGRHMHEIRHMVGLWQPGK